MSIVEGKFLNPHKDSSLEIQEKVLTALAEFKAEGTRFVPFGSLVKRINKDLGEKEKIKRSKIREAVGALKHQGKIESEEYNNVEFVYLV